MGQAASNYNVAGFPAITSDFLPDDTAQYGAGEFMGAMDNYWGGRELVYARATGAIRQFGLCVITPALVNGAWVATASEVPNTAGLGQSLAVAMTAIGASGGWVWFCIGGLVPVNCNASVTANTAFGIAAAGQGGAITAGKQVLGGRVVAAATASVSKANCYAPNGTTQLQVPNTDGWFRGITLVGSGIAAGTTIASIDPANRVVTLSLATTAAVNGSISGTYNNGTVFYNVAYLNRPLAQGQIT